jgi:hypothetical protein
MTNTRLDAGFSGVSALLMACLACTSLEDLSSYSSGSAANSAAPPSFQAPPDAGTDEPPPQTPDAGAPEPPAVETPNPLETPNPADVPLVPPDTADASDDCTALDEFTSAGSASCYRLGDATTSWLDARDFCQAWGGDLAEITSVEENNLVAQRSDQDVWLGASDTDEEGNFRWIGGADVEGPWAFAQPDDYEGREDCVELRAMDDRWNDAPCTTEKAALCERALGSDAAP